MSDDDGLVAALKQETDQATAPPVAAPADDGLIATLKQETDNIVSGTPPTSSGTSAPSGGDEYGSPFARKVAMHESGMRADAKNPGSSALGAGQFINSTWEDLIKRHRPDLAQGKSDAQIDALRTNPHLSLDMIDAYAQDNTDKLQQAGVPVNDGTLYGAHHFGPDKFAQIYNADPTTPIEDLIGKHTAAINGIAGKSAYSVANSQARAMKMEGFDKDLTLSEANHLAMENLGDSYKAGVRSLAHAVLHLGDTGAGIVALGKGLRSKIEGEIGIDQDPEQKAKDEAPLDALGALEKERYGGTQNVLNTWARDPFGTLLDLSGVLSAGGGIAAKIGSVAGKLPLVGGAGDALAAVGKAASVVGQNINPLNPGRIISRVIGSGAPQALDKAGNVVPEVEGHLNKLGTSGADLTPEQREILADSIAKKGMTLPAVKEGVLRAAGLKTPTQLTTGVSLGGGRAAQEAADAATIDNNVKLGSAATALGGGAPSDTGLAEALDRAHTTSLNQASGLYDTIRNIPGHFTNMNVPGLLRSAGQKLTAASIPANPAMAARTGYQSTAKALNLINDTWGQRRTILPPTGSGANEVLAMRQALSGMRQEANAAERGGDAVGVGHIMDALDNTIASQASGGHFVSPAGSLMTGKDLAAILKRASSAYRQHFATFDENPDPAIARTVAQLQKARGPMKGPIAPLADPAVYRATQEGLGKSLLDPSKGARTYQNLMAATGNAPEVKDFVRSSLLNTDQAGAFKPVKGAQTMLNDPNTSAAKALSPDELAQARLLYAAHGINNGKIKGRLGSSLATMLGGTGAKLASAYLGEHAFGTMGGIAGPIAEGLLERGAERLAIRRALAGAPAKTARTTKLTKGITNALLTQPLTSAAIAGHREAEEEKQHRKGHAAGGTVTIDEDKLVDGLMRRWKHAKKLSDGQTKTLLKVPDATIVAALKGAGSKL